MPGLAMFLQGECYTILGSYENAVVSFRKCIEIRSNLSLQIQQRDDVHISANAEYSLGLILAKQSEVCGQQQMFNYDIIRKTFSD